MKDRNHVNAGNYRKNKHFIPQGSKGEEPRPLIGAKAMFLCVFYFYTYSSDDKYNSIAIQMFLFHFMNSKISISEVEHCPPKHQLYKSGT